MSEGFDIPFLMLCSLSLVAIAVLWTKLVRQNTETKQLASHNADLTHSLQTVEVEFERFKQQSDTLTQEAKSVFLANMSHEIRTPMNAIIGLTHLVKRDATNDHQRQLLDKISHAAEHLMGILNNLLDYSKIEGGKISHTPSDFNLQKTLRHVIDLIEPEARQKGLFLALQADALPTMVHGDGEKIEQVLNQFASNALKFTDHGSLTLRAKLLSEDKRKLRVRFEVEDSGIGISTEQAKRLFKAFEQVDSSTSRKYGGTGLGLALCRRLAYLLGGEVGVNSVPGQGSTFWLEIALEHRHTTSSVASDSMAANAETTKPEINAIEQQLRQHHGQTILMAEDNLLNQEVVFELLKAVGLRPEIANTGKEVIALAKQAKFDLVLMDVLMPEMTGIEATEILRSLPIWEKIPILAMTASTEEDDRERCLAAGMNDHVSKPVDPAKLYATLLKWLPTPIDSALPPDSPAEVSSQKLAENTAEDLMIRSRLENIPALSLHKGLRSVRGKAHRLQSLLIRFGDDHADDGEKMLQMIALHQIQDVQHLAHTLKGIAGTLGLLDLQSLSDALQLAAKQEKNAELLLPLALAIRNSLNQITPSIRAFTSDTGEQVASEEDKSDPAVFDQAMKSALEKLQVQLQNDDLTATHSYRTLQPQLLRLSQQGKLSRSDMRLLAKHIDAYAFDEALEVLLKIEQQLGAEAGIAHCHTN